MTHQRTLAVLVVLGMCLTFVPVMVMADCGSCQPSGNGYTPTGVSTYYMASNATILKDRFTTATTGWTNLFHDNNNPARFNTGDSGNILVSLQDSICPRAWSETSGSNVYICPDLLTQSDAFINRTIYHEVGHRAGLDNANSCSAADSVMVEIGPSQMSGATVSIGCADQNAVHSLFFRRDDDADGYSPDDPNQYLADCDDSDATVYPGAQIDCSSNVDHDCNGVPDSQESACEYNPDPGSPIVIDLSGDGVKLTSLEDGVVFDLNANHRPLQIPWTYPSRANGWLALDRDGDGQIRFGTELFGDRTPQPRSVTPNGFAALALYDLVAEGGNSDGWIDSQDAVYTRLRIWLDRNHDGVSQPDELLTLQEAGVEKISLAYVSLGKQDRWGNQFRFAVKIVGPGNKWAYDVFLTGK